MSSTTGPRPGTARPTWRTVDIVTASVIAVAFGVVFFAYAALWAAVSPAFLAFPPAQGAMYGVWMVPAVVAALVLRKPGAAVFAEVVAATIEALMGSHFGILVIVYGLCQGLAVEAAFAAGRYRSWGLRRSMVGGALAGVAAVVLDRTLRYPEWDAVWTGAYTALVVPSCALVTGLGGWLLVRRLADTGVLAPFPSGRAAREV